MRKIPDSRHRGARRIDAQFLPGLPRLHPPCIPVARRLFRGRSGVGPVYGRRSGLPRADNRSYPARCRLESHHVHEREVSDSLPRWGGPISLVERPPGFPRRRNPWRRGVIHSVPGSPIRERIGTVLAAFSGEGWCAPCSLRFGSGLPRAGFRFPPLGSSCSRLELSDSVGLAGFSGNGAAELAG
jgi:hypothetical protein